MLIREIISTTQTRLIAEQIIIRDRAVSDVDGEMRDLTIHLNPGRQETAALLARSIEHTLRGFVNDKDGKGTIVIWDAYLTDHDGAESLLKKHGYGDWWPRFSMCQQDFDKGVIRNYIDTGMEEAEWDAIPKAHLQRMLGSEPTFDPT